VFFSKNSRKSVKGSQLPLTECSLNGQFFDHAYATTK